MPSVSSAFVLFVTAFLALWPVAFLVALVYHSLARQWRRVGHAALLLPLWTIAASVGLTQLGPLLAALDAKPGSKSPFVAVTAVGFALGCAALAWALLLRTFDRRPPQLPGRRPVM